MSTKKITTKVCILGAGPAGLIIANILSKYRIPCIVVEKYTQSEIYARSRAGLIDYKTVTILQEHGLSDRLFKIGKPHSKCEFRTPEHSFILDYGRISGGQTHYIYPQQELLVDLIDKFRQTGGKILFNTQGISIENNRYGGKVRCQQENNDLVIESEFIAGCDGFHGVSRASIPETVLKARIKHYNYAWLAVTAEAPPSTKHIIYGIHPRGFAGHMLRTETISRYYLQIPLEDTADNWSSDRIWSELQLRLAKDDWSLTQGRIIGKQVLTMRSFSTQTMQYNNLFLAGDSAHILTPAGGKGMNLAIQDADVLGRSLASYYRYYDNQALKNYSATRLPQVLQTQEFSESLLHTINIPSSNDPQEAMQRSLGGFPHERLHQEAKLLKLLQKFKLSQLINSPSYARDFARKYVGYAASSSMPLPKFENKPALVRSFTKKLKPLVIVRS